MHRLDEELPVYIVFRTPLLEDDTLTSYLQRLAVNLDVFAFSNAPAPEGEPKAGPTKEVIFSTIIKDTEKPTIVRHGDGDEAHTYIFWKIDAFIARPQGRFHKPAIYFQPTASFKPASTPKTALPDDEYLPSRVPTAINLLQAFDNDPALAGVRPRLSAMRINKIAPSATPVVKELIRPISSGQRPLFRVLPALIWRIRYARVHASLNDLSLMASLDLEVASYHTYDLQIKKVNLILHGGTVKSFANTTDPTTTYKPGDQLTYLYKITPDRAADGAPALGSKGHYLTMHVDATVQINRSCHSKIAITWKTPVDFTASIDQPPALMKAAHRLSNPSLSKFPLNPDALPTHDTPPADDKPPTNPINITLTISGPESPVKVGQQFCWKIFIVNRSDKVRKLAILVIPRRKREFEKHAHAGSRPSTSSTTPAALPATTTAPAPAPATNTTGTTTTVATTTTPLLSPAVLDENVIYAKQISARTENADLVCLTTDIRLGQLSPGSCYTADVKFVPLCAGVLGVESVRVVDLATNEVVDVRDLPGVVAVDGSRGGSGDGEGEEEDDDEEEEEDEEE